MAARTSPVRLQRYTHSVKVGFSITHHDHAYVQRRGGWELLTHMRGAAARVAYRREAIDRALALYEQAAHDGRSGPEVGGNGLIVLQRALLAAEDLGGLLHAFAGPHPWDRLRATNIARLDEAFTRAAGSTELVLQEAFRIPTDEHLRDEEMTDAERPAFGRLRARVAQRWTGMLKRAATLWLPHRAVAKATMHGFPLVAGEHVVGPPGAGELREGVRWPDKPFAIAVTSSERGGHVRSDRHLVLLDSDSVRRYHRDGRCAAQLAGELCESHSASIMEGCAAMLPTELVRTLSREDQALIEELAARRQRESGGDGPAT